MKKYKVNVNGTMYEITLEVADESEVKSAQASGARGSSRTGSSSCRSRKRECKRSHARHDPLRKCKGGRFREEGRCPLCT